jgi:enoyl-CoA hydratase/carnithine racemase
MKTSNEKSFFSVATNGAIASFEFNDCPILHGSNLIAKDKFLSQFVRFSEDDKIKVILLFFSSKINSCGLRLLEDKHSSVTENIFAKRIHNSINQYRRMILNCSKITIYVDNSKINSISMNIGLFCDYKILPEGVVFQNSYFLDNLIPIGGETYFLGQRLGRKRMFDYLFLNKEIDQNEAMKIGLVSEVVQERDIERIAYERAQQFAEKPYYYITGVKKLLNNSDRDLDACLSLESKVVDYCMNAHSYLKK